MRNLRLITAILILLIPAMLTAQPPDAQKPKKSCSTHFELDEDPISENGKWINGGKDGDRLGNVITKNESPWAVSKGSQSALVDGNVGQEKKVKARVFSRDKRKYYQRSKSACGSSPTPHRLRSLLACEDPELSRNRQWNGKPATDIINNSASNTGQARGSCEASITGNASRTTQWRGSDLSRTTRTPKAIRGWGSTTASERAMATSVYIYR
jgi:hypothetical protein